MRESAAVPSGIRRFAVFLAVVWSVAGALIGLEAAYLRIYDFLRTRWVPPAMALPMQSRNARVHCEDVVKALPAYVPQPSFAAQSKHAAWHLGRIAGFTAALLTAEIATPDVVSRMLGSTRPLAEALGVPEPGVPSGGLAANALRRFNVHLAEDPQCVAAALERRHSSRHAALFRFGASVSVAAFYRYTVPEAGAAFDVEVSTYGNLASVPSELWRPLLQPPDAGLRGAELKQNTETMVERIDNYIKLLQ